MINMYMSGYLVASLSYDLANITDGVCKHDGRSSAEPNKA